MRTKCVAGERRHGSAVAGPLEPLVTQGPAVVGVRVHWVPQVEGVLAVNEALLGRRAAAVGVGRVARGLLEGIHVVQGPLPVRLRLLAPLLD